MTIKFVGPIISTSDLDAWKHLLIEAFDLREICRQSFSVHEVETLWGLAGHRAEAALFETAGTPYGIRVLQLSPNSATAIRQQASGYDCNALKVIDFYAPDFDEARTRLERAGYSLKADIAEYDLLSARITEAHLWGPDGVVCALISGPVDFFSSFVGVTSAVVSEVLSVSAPVDRPDDVIGFYRDLGLEDVYRYEITDESFQHLVGVQEPLHIRAVNMGSRRDEPYFGIIHYGLPAGSYRSLRDRARLPNRGLVGATLVVDDIDAAYSICRERQFEIVTGCSLVELLPYGPVMSMAVRAPHGVLHQLLQFENVGRVSVS